MLASLLIDTLIDTLIWLQRDSLFLFFLPYVQLCSQVLLPCLLVVGCFTNIFDCVLDPLWMFYKQNRLCLRSFMDVLETESILLIDWLINCVLGFLILHVLQTYQFCCWFIINCVSYIIILREWILQNMSIFYSLISCVLHHHHPSFLNVLQTRWFSFIHSFLVSLLFVDWSIVSLRGGFCKGEKRRGLWRRGRHTWNTKISRKKQIPICFFKRFGENDSKLVAQELW